MARQLSNEQLKFLSEDMEGVLTLQKRRAYARSVVNELKAMSNMRQLDLFQDDETELALILTNYYLLWKESENLRSAPRLRSNWKSTTSKNRKVSR